MNCPFLPYNMFYKVWAIHSFFSYLVDIESRLSYVSSHDMLAMISHCIMSHCKFYFPHKIQRLLVPNFSLAVNLKGITASVESFNFIDIILVKWIKCLDLNYYCNAFKNFQEYEWNLVLPWNATRLQLTQEHEYKMMLLRPENFQCVSNNKSLHYITL